MGQAQAQQQMQVQTQQAVTIEQAKQQGAAEAMAAAPVMAPTRDLTTELKKLADLHKSGVLTDEEFAAAKKKVLG